jgi:hypothetical protein
VGGWLVKQRVDWYPSAGLPPADQLQVSPACLSWGDVFYSLYLLSFSIVKFVGDRGQYGKFGGHRLVLGVSGSTIPNIPPPYRLVNIPRVISVHCTVTLPQLPRIPR